MKTGYRFPISDLKSQISNVTILSMALAAGSFAFASVPPQSTDDQLRDSLDSKVSDDYDRELLGDTAKPDDKGRVDDQMQKKLQKELGPAAQKEDKPKSPLLQVAEAMREVPTRLDHRDSGEETQHLQRQIVADLEKLIETAKKSGSCSGTKSNCQKPTGGGGKKPAQPSQQASGKSTAPAQRSDPKVRKPEEIRSEAARNASKIMIDLFQPELQRRDREHVLELPGEHFLPGYELEIEDYFRRLSADHPGLEKP